MSSKPLSKPASRSNTQNLTFQNTLQNTPVSVTLPPAPITTTIKSMMIPFSTQLDHLSPFTHHLQYATILKSTTAYRYSVPYPTSPPITLSPSSLSSSGFTQPFTPFSPGPLGAWQVPLTSSGPPPLGNPPLSSPSSSASSRHENLPSTFYMLRDSIMPSPSSLPPSSMLFSPSSFFCSWKANDQLST